MRILITGGAGYLGSIVAEHLLGAGLDVVVLDNLMYGQSSLLHLCSQPGFEFVRGDCRDPRVLHPLIKVCDVLLPLAAIVGAEACKRNPLDARTTNLNAVSLLNRLRSPDQLLIFPATNSGYGSGEVCTEDSALMPLSLYGQTKVQAESDVLSKANAISLRLATVFGASPRMRTDLLVNHLVYAAVFDRYAVIYQKDYKRNYVHVRDVADCFLYCIRHPQMQGKPYNLGLDSANLSKEELAFKIRTVFPDFYIHFAELGTDPDKRNYTISSERLRQAGFEATRSLDDGIRELKKAYEMLSKPHANA